MNAPRESDRLIRAFLDEGRTELPDRAFDAVRGDIHRTRQRVVIGPWREPDMSTIARVGIAAAAVLAIGIAWINVAPSKGPSVGGVATPSPTSTPSPSPSAQPLSNGPLQPGRYSIPVSGVTAGAPFPKLSLTLPAGWSGDLGLLIDKNYGSSDAEAGPAFSVWQVNGTFIHPCTNHTLVTPTPGPGIDPLIAALARQPGTSAGSPTAVTVDGYDGKFVEVTVTDNVPACGFDQFWLWASPDGDRRYVQGTDEMNRIYVLDIEGQRFTFAARFPAQTTAADRTEFETILRSIEIEPSS